MPQKKTTRNETPVSKKILLAVIAIGILLGMLYVLNGNRFPSEISYENLR